MQQSSDKIGSITLENLILLEDQPEFNSPASIVTCKGDVPQPRNAHKSFLKDKKLYVYGGTTDVGDQMSLHTLDISKLGDSEQLLWRELKLNEKQTTIGVTGVAFTSEQFSQSPQCRPFVLMFGGWTGSDYSDRLSLLDTTNMEIKSLIKEETKFVETGGSYPRVAVSIGNSKEIEKYQQSKYPPARKDHTFVFVPSENKICLYGGWDGQFTSGGKEELWILSSNWKWEKYPGYSRRGHTSVVVDDHRGNGFLVFGGIRGAKSYSKQCLFFDVKNKKWHTIKENASTPRGRAYHTADKIGNKIVYVGGMGDNNEILGEVWLFCLDKHQWTRVNLHQKHLEEQIKRCGHTTFVADKRLYIIGGMTFRHGKFVRCSLSELVCLDFSEIPSETRPHGVKMQSMLVPETTMARGASMITSNNIHNTDHKWDIMAFGFITKKKDDLEDFYKELEEKMPGLSQSQMDENAP